MVKSLIGYFIIAMSELHQAKRSMFASCLHGAEHQLSWHERRTEACLPLC